MSSRMVGYNVAWYDCGHIIMDDYFSYSYEGAERFAAQKSAEMGGREVWVTKDVSVVTSNSGYSVQKCRVSN